MQDTTTSSSVETCVVVADSTIPELKRLATAMLTLYKHKRKPGEGRVTGCTDMKLSRPQMSLDDDTREAAEIRVCISKRAGIKEARNRRQTLRSWS